MKDYRSLESKIRSVVEGREKNGWTQITENEWVHHIAGILAHRNGDGKMQYFNSKMEEVTFVEGNTNDAKRTSDTVVGRPDTASNASDPRAKLNKQAQIKTKIIDESKDADPKAKDKPKKVDPKKKDDKKDPPKDDDKPKQPDDKPAGKKGSFEPAGKNDTPTAKEKPQQKDNSKEIQKVADGNDKKDPKEIKGGKTEVDVHPTTNDKVDDGTTGQKPGKEVKEDALLELSARTLKDYVNRTGVHRDTKYPKLALKKLADKKQKAQERKMRKEDLQLDEISDKKAGEYLDKGHESWKKAKASGDKGTMAKRGKGSALATRKMLGVNAKVKTTKEDFSEDELKYFEAVMAEEYVDMSKKNVDAVINAKGKPHKVYTNTDETRHGIGVEELMRHLGVSGGSSSVQKKFMHNLHTAGVRTGWSHSTGKWIAYHGKKI